MESGDLEKSHFYNRLMRWNLRVLRSSVQEFTNLKPASLTDD